MSAFDEEQSRALLVICAGDEQTADFITRVVANIEGRDLTDDDLRVLAWGIRFGRHLHSGESGSSGSMPVPSHTRQAPSETEPP